jgi:hypothetical protein
MIDGWRGLAGGSAAGSRGAAMTRLSISQPSTSSHSSASSLQAPWTRSGNGHITGNWLVAEIKTHGISCPSTKNRQNTTETKVLPLWQSTRWQHKQVAKQAKVYQNNSCCKTYVKGCACEVRTSQRPLDMIDPTVSTEHTVACATVLFTKMQRCKLHVNWLINW